MSHIIRVSSPNVEPLTTQQVLGLARLVWQAKSARKICGGNGPGFHEVDLLSRPCNDQGGGRHHPRRFRLGRAGDRLGTLIAMEWLMSDQRLPTRRSGKFWKGGVILRPTAVTDFWRLRQRQSGKAKASARRRAGGFLPVHPRNQRLRVILRRDSRVGSQPALPGRNLIAQGWRRPCFRGGEAGPARPPG